MSFQSVPENKWQLNDRVTSERKAQLLGTPFEDIVQNITNRLQINKIWRECIKKYPESERIRIELTLPNTTVDCFHNGAGGYRAQFYISTAQGEAANRFFLNHLAARLQQIDRLHSCSSIPWDFVAASLCDPDAKAWIRQGTWFRQKLHIDRNLSVERWIINGDTMPLRHRYIRFWACLTPAYETRIDIKGGCVDGAFKPIGATLKPCRSEEIHTLGYT